ncbi:MAG: RNA pseudouridine synthase [Myxococcales bacterium]|nr:RNA pseudouridine synthase [Myxococcales bacterium]
MRRSPAAERHDPPARAHRWQAEAPIAADDVPARVCAEADLSAADWAGVLAHGGLWIDRKRWTGQPLPAGALCVVYAFTRPPVEPPLGPDALLFDAHGLLAINKPAWWPTQGTRASAAFSAEARVQALFGDPALRAVHRLDRQTSGVLLFAREGRLAGRIHDQFRAHAVHKRYLARVAPPPAADRFTVRGPLVRVANEGHSRFALDEGAAGLDSKTDFAVIERHADEALIEARPHTGRTHQLRVHLAHHGCPIRGDALYGPEWRPGAPERVLLHALRLRLKVDGRGLDIEAPPPPDLTR